MPIETGMRLSIPGNQKRIAIISVLVLVVIFSFTAGRVLVGTWHANMGSVALAKFELQNWPTNEWAVLNENASLEPIEKSFRSALRYSPSDRTALYRLGLIAMMERDFADAVLHLEEVYNQQNDHHGVKKNLAYAYTWIGEIEKALPLLKEIPEALQEMEVYGWWWGIQGEEELAQRAALAASAID
jgi:tetratricopeptide (TPR) repeat protein